MWSSFTYLSLKLKWQVEHVWETLICKIKKTLALNGKQLLCSDIAFIPPQSFNPIWLRDAVYVYGVLERRLLFKVFLKAEMQKSKKKKRFLIYIQWAYKAFGHIRHTGICINKWSIYLNLSFLKTAIDIHSRKKYHGINKKFQLGRRKNIHTQKSNNSLKTPTIPKHEKGIVPFTFSYTEEAGFEAGPIFFIFLSHCFYFLEDF